LYIITVHYQTDFKQTGDTVHEIMTDDNIKPKLRFVHTVYEASVLLLNVKFSMPTCLEKTL